MERELTWDGWARSLDDALVSPAGRLTLSWVVGVLRQFFGESWLTGNAAETSHVPLLNAKWWPLTNSRAIARVLELAARIALVTASEANSQLSDEAKTIYTSPELVGTKFYHLCLTLETAAFAVMAGWNVSYEEQGASRRKPDLVLRRNAVRYAVEVTILGLDREFRTAQRYCDHLHRQLRSIELRHGVEFSCHAKRILDDTDMAMWLDEIESASKQTASDGHIRAISWGESTVEVFAADQRPPGQIFRGPIVSGDVWRRVASRITEKADQTTGSHAWLRIDDTGTLFHLSDRLRQPLPDLLNDLHTNAAIALADAPHARGIILSTGALASYRDPREESAWRNADPAVLIAPGPPRHLLAVGPSAMVRQLPGGRSRATFVLPGPHPHLILPAGTDLEPGMWYHNEPSWLTRALQALGHPPLHHILY